MKERPLGRRVPTDFTHVEKYPYSALLTQTVSTVEKILPLPSWHQNWDQGSEGACVGFGSSMMMSITNEYQARQKKQQPYNHRYDPIWLWNEAKKVDEWPDTNPGDNNGTSVRAACDVLRTQGHRRIIGNKELDPNPAEGISANRWATSIDEMRTAISQGLAISFGCNWYTNFDAPSRPFLKERDYWVGTVNNLGTVRGGHDVCFYGASDKRQGFIFKNSWGKSYPLTWIPYSVVERLLNESGESALITDR